MNDIKQVTGFKLSDEDRQYLQDYGLKHIKSNNMTLAIRMIIDKTRLSEQL